MSTFKDLGLSEDLLKSLTELGFDKPTPIQEQAIPFLISSEQDLIALAQTGTGKTAAFSLPMIDKINPQSKAVQALIIAPTRELCQQIEQDIFKFTKYMNGVQSVAIYGGESITHQFKRLSKSPQIIVGTPGRLVDMLNRGKINVSGLKWLVLDEADEMLNMGFKDELDAILEDTPDTKQTLLFSATMDRNVEPIARKYMNDAHKIEVAQRNVGSDNVTHEYYVAHARDRYNVLKRIADVNPNVYGIVFCRTRRETQDVADKLMNDHYSADALHGDMSQAQRNYVMEKFKKGQIQLLVATDVAARGIDVDNLTHVINYNLPEQLEAYVHRSGRTGRAHNKGVAVTIVHMKEVRQISILEKKVGKKFERKMVPNGAEICEVQLLALIDKIKESHVNEDQIAKYLPEIMNRLSDLDKEDIIKKFVSIEFNRFLEFYKNAPDLNVQVNDSARVESNVKSYACFEINLGKNTKLGPKSLFEMLNSIPALRGSQVGEIHILNDKSYFEIDATKEQDVLKFLNGSKFKGSDVELTYLGDKKNEGASSDRSQRRSGARRSRNRSGGGSGDRSRNRPGGSANGSRNRDRRRRR